MCKLDLSLSHFNGLKPNLKWQIKLPQNSRDLNLKISNFYLLSNMETGSFEAMRTHGHKAPNNWSNDPTEAPTKQDADWWSHRLNKTPTDEGTKWTRWRLMRAPTEQDDDWWKHRLKKTPIDEVTDWTRWRLMKSPTEKDADWWSHRLNKMTTDECTNWAIRRLMNSPTEQDGAQGAARRNSAEGVISPFLFSSFAQDGAKVYYRYLALGHAQVRYLCEEDNWIIKP